MSLERLRGGLIAEGFEGTIHDDAGSRAVYGTDNSIYQLSPVGIVVPRTAEDIAAIVRANNTLAAPFELVARGGGTGTNGQSLTNGVVVDTRRATNRILSVDIEAQEAVVEPGVVLGQLNGTLASSGLFFAPHASTATRATIGGMVATDAAGKGSLVHGRTNRHVMAIGAILDDGTAWTFQSVSLAEAEELAQRVDSVGDIYRQLLVATDGIGPADFPDIPRGFTGYNLADARTADRLDVTKVLCGSEGTLALITEIRIRLTPLPTEQHLAVVAYTRFEDAVRDANRLKVTGPSAIECLDERTISLASASPAFPALTSLLDVAGASLLLLEYEGVEGLHALRDLLPEGGESAGMAHTAEPATIAAVWKVRADAVGLLAQAVDGRRSIAFVEDCAVPPDHLDAFVAGYRELLDRHGLTYGMFGHADVGCIHVRPALDLYTDEHEKLLRVVSDEVAELVSSFGGVLWGEHGRGFRGEYLDLRPDLVHRMRLIKTAFDPRNLLNPGKLYSPLKGAPPIKRIDEVPLRVHHDRSVAESTRLEFDSAFACNGNGICHHWGNAEVMCPSFKATLDPRLSPKGRADLLRSWLARPDDASLADDVADSMRQCLSCGACTGRCPVQVDIPELKSRFLEQHPESNRRRKLRDAALSRFEAALPRVQRAAGFAGVTQRVWSPLIARALGVVDLPMLPSGSLASRLAQLGVAQVSDGADPGDATVVLLPDAFTAFLEPEVMVASLELMVALGERPVVARFVPSGKYDHVKGRRQRFRAAAAARRSYLESLDRHGLPLVIVEPAVYLLHHHEYPAIDPSFPTQAVTSLPDYLLERIDRLEQRPDAGPAQLFGHCTEMSLAPHHDQAYQQLLERAGYAVRREATTCCGMAGIFGHEEENQAMSRRLFDDSWRPLLAAESVGERCAPGYSCREQSKRFGGAGLVHPVALLRDAYAVE